MSDNTILHETPWQSDDLRARPTDSCESSEEDLIHSSDSNRLDPFSKDSFTDSLINPSCTYVSTSAGGAIESI